MSKKVKEIDGENVEILSKDIFCCNSFDVEVGTNGYKGGDWGHGSRTYFKIQNTAGSSIEVNVSKFKDGFEVTLGGDSELQTIIEALEFIVETLKYQSEEEKKKDTIDRFVRDNSDLSNFPDYVMMRLLLSLFRGDDLTELELESMKLLLQLYSEES